MVNQLSTNIVETKKKGKVFLAKEKTSMSNLKPKMKQKKAILTSQYILLLPRKSETNTVDTCTSMTQHKLHMQTT